MSVHRAEQIIDAVAAALAASSSLASAVFKHRRYSLSEGEQELPAVVVDMGADQPTSEYGVSNVAFIDSLLDISVQILVRADSEEEAATQLLTRRVAQHIALMADRSLGLPFVMDTRYGGAGAPVYDVSTDRVAGSLTCRWVVHYRMNLSDPS